jgi:hypothetical protein
MEPTSVSWHSSKEGFRLADKNVADLALQKWDVGNQTQIKVGLVA